MNIKLCVVLLFSFLVSGIVFAKNTKNERAKMRPLILSLNQLNDGVSYYGSVPNVKCNNEIYDDQNFIQTKEYYKESEDVLLNLIQLLINNNTIDKLERSVTQNETNRIVEKIEQLKLRNDDLEKISSRIASNKNTSLKDRSQIIGIINDVKSVKNQMDEYINLGSVSCNFLYNDDMKKNIGSDSTLYNHENFSNKDKTYFDLDDIIIVGKCKGRGLLVLPEFQTHR